MHLTKDDYEKIVKHYGYTVSKTKKNKRHNIKTRKLARDILVNKLCKCIKTVEKRSRLKETSAIAICNNSIFSKRNIRLYKFTCKKPRLLTNKGRKYYLKKTQKNIKFSKK